MTLNNRELATALAALRFWQRTFVRPGDELIPREEVVLFDDATPLRSGEIDVLIEEKLNHVDELEIDHPLTDEERNEVRCALCKKWCSMETAHLHQDEYIGDECCWDERLRASE